MAEMMTTDEWKKTARQ